MSMNSRVRFKFCGLSRPEDIEAANEISPDYIGFVFAPSSRQVTREQAAGLRKLLSPEIRAVGVFVNAAIEEILSLAGDGKMPPVIDLIQLHGDENAEYIRQLKQFTDCPIIKAVRVKSRDDIEKADRLPCDYLLLDTYTKGQYGGSGLQFDWSMIPPLAHPFFLAGGISADNAEKAGKTGAFCLDVSSAIETDGRKDKRKMRAFKDSLA